MNGIEALALRKRRLELGKAGRLEIILGLDETLLHHDEDRESAVMSNRFLGYMMGGNLGFDHA